MKQLQRILYLLPQPVYPPDTGPKHLTFGILKYMSAKYCCDIVGFVHKDTDVQAYTALSNALPNTNIIKLIRRQTNPRWIWSRLYKGLRSQPVSFATYESAELTAWLKQAVQDLDYDLVHFDTFNVSFYRAYCGDVPTVLVPYDAFSMGIKRASVLVKRPLTQLAYWWKWRAYSGYEKKAYRHFTKVCPVSEVDTQWLAALDSTIDLDTIGIPVGDEFLNHVRQDYSKLHQPHILVAGTLTIDTVTIGMVEFVEQIYPIIREALPEARVTIWGRGLTSSLQRALRNHPELNYVSYVDDYLSFLGSATIYVFPQRCGAGIQTKVQQAMALGIPVITRSHVLNALGAISGTHALSNDDNLAMALSVIDLARNHTQQSKIGVSGAKLMQEKYSRDKIGSMLKKVYEDAIRKHHVKGTTHQ